MVDAALRLLFIDDVILIEELQSCDVTQILGIQ